MDGLFITESVRVSDLYITADEALNLFLHRARIHHVTDTEFSSSPADLRIVLYSGIRGLRSKTNRRNPNCVTVCCISRLLRCVYKQIDSLDRARICW